MLRECGLDAYYDLAKEFGAKPAKPQAAEIGYEAYDSPVFHDEHVIVRKDGLLACDLVLEGVSCAACVWLIERLPRAAKGVVESRLNLRDSSVHIVWDPRKIKLSTIAWALGRLGYPPHPYRGKNRGELYKKEERSRLIHIGVAGALMGNLMLLAFALYAGWLGDMESQHRIFFRWISMLLGLAALIFPGRTFFVSALGAIRVGAVNLDVPIALALLVGGVTGTFNVVFNRGEIYFDSLSALVFLLLVGRWMQFKQQRRAADAVDLLFCLTPSFVRKIEGDKTVSVPVEALTPGDCVRVLPDELFPADGEVISGVSEVNLSLLTGESAPAPVKPGEAVLAGTRNLQSTLDIRVKSAGETTRLGKLMKLVERGISDRAPVVRMADRVGYYFTFAIIAASILAFFLGFRESTSEGLDRALALLIVACPCVLGLTTPLTFSLAIGMLARKHILVKSSAALETLSKPGVMLLDKTGTLTLGKMTRVRTVGDESLLKAIAAIEKHSVHPIARILSENADEMAIENPTRIFDGMTGTLPDGRQLRVGSEKMMRREGMVFDVPTGTGDETSVFAAIDGVVKTRIDLEDPIRDEIGLTLKSLRDKGWSLRILSGDRTAAVMKTARALGIDEALAELSPEDKLAEVKRIEPCMKRVMVGDGANDAAALAAADAGIALRGGAEVALAAADVYIADEHPKNLLVLTNAARSAMKTIRVNLGISLAYNILAATLAATGHMHPLIAAILMPASSVTVTAVAAAKMRKVAEK